jgi:hypothetical protein
MPYAIAWRLGSSAQMVCGFSAVKEAIWKALIKKSVFKDQINRCIAMLVAQ